MRRIVRRPAIELPDEVSRRLPGVLQRVYARRAIRSARELELGLGHLLPPGELAGIDAATRLLAEALRRQRRICVVGDFDADGATSCALALRGLRAMGARRIGYLVPNRFEYGYGLSPELVALAAREQAPELIITVDNGISSLEGVAAARARGIDVLVTDHHLPGEVLPEADAIVNPNLPGQAFGSRALAGVGVMFYVLVALRGHLRRTGWFTDENLQEPRLDRLLDLVALGTVADVVPLDHNNRILVAQGLGRIRTGQGCPGIRALLEVAGRDPDRLVASDLGFAAGPRLNAAGRLTDMALGVECLLTDDPRHAQRLAARLDGLNRERRQIEAQMTDEALALLDHLGDPVAGGERPLGLCLTDGAWHQGVIGIVASRLKERYQCPVVAFAPTGEGMLKGSGRSVPGLHLRDLLEAISRRHPGLVPKFGGHAMAAGLSLAAADFPRFREAFEAALAEALEDGLPDAEVASDGELSGAELNLDAARQLREAGPWGQGFPEPVFDGCFQVLDSRIVGERHVRLNLAHPGGNGALEAIAFNGAARGWEALDGACPRLAYRLDVNHWRGRERAQLVVEHVEA